MRLTKHRQDILSVLETSREALSAAEIQAHLPAINLVTIYRTLEYFLREEMIKKLHFGRLEAKYELQEEPHHHAICRHCQNVLHFTLNDKKLQKEFSLPRFQIENLEITLHGVCAHHYKKILK